MIRIENPTSLPESIRTRLCYDAWAEGVETFFNQSVPFTGRSNMLTASQLVDFFVITANLATSPPPHFHVYELGAGTGLLSFYFLSGLREKAPDLFKRTTLHSSDFSEAGIAQFASLYNFKEFGEHIKLQVMNAQAPVFNPDESPFFVFSSYFLDSLPTRFIGIKQKKIHDIFIQTDLDEQASIIDIEQSSVRSLNAHQIKDILVEDKFIAQRQILGNKILNKLRFTDVWQPIEPLLLMSEEEKKCLKKIVGDLEIENGEFNFSYAIKQHLEIILSTLHPEGIYITSDGFSSENIRHLTSMGKAYYCAVNTPIIRSFVEDLGGFFSITDHKYPVKTMLMIKSNNENIIKHLHLVFDTEVMYSIHLANENLIKISQTNHVDSILEFYKNLPADIQSNYEILIKMAAILYDKGRYSESLIFCEKSLFHPFLAFNGLYFKGLNNISLGNSEQVEKVIHAMEQVAAKNWKTQDLKIRYFKLLGRKEAAQESFNTLFKYYHSDDIELLKRRYKTLLE